MSKCKQETKQREFINEQIDQEQADSKKLKQALADIKDFVENELIPNYNTRIILQIISEVEDDR